MTSNEIMAFTRSMLDDGIDHLLYWHNDRAQNRLRLSYFIWEAQLAIVKEKLTADDTRALRPLTVERDVRHVLNRNTTPEERRLIFDKYVTPTSYYRTRMLAVKSVRIMRDNAPLETGIVATFMPQATYDNIQGPFDRLTPYAPNQVQPYTMYYTVEPDINISSRVPDTACLNYTADIFGTYAKVIFIRYPSPFNFDNTLDLPEEFHHEVCLKAAEMVNTLDVAETERGVIASGNLGQRLTIEEAQL